jgi:hypothetical protein
LTPSRTLARPTPSGTPGGQVTSCRWVSDRKSNRWPT